MTLATYHKKRNFTKTSEPKGKIPKKNNSVKKLYVIQKHAASHLHYDFRLELNGVLISWAVPKGPSLNPNTKRLAMHVEDHPIEYGSFEGIIPEGEYGGGTVMLWDTGEWICIDKNPLQAYKKGNLTFTLHGKKLKGKWKLIRIQHNDKTWLLIKLKDDYSRTDLNITEDKPLSVLTKQSLEEIAANYNKIWKSNKKKIAKKKINLNELNLADSDKKISKKLASELKDMQSINLPTSSMPRQIFPQLATLVDKAPQENKWVHEIKFDGYRLIIYKKNKQVKIYTRNQNDWTKYFKRIAAAVQRLPVDNVILDGEVVALDEKHRSNFQLLQNTLKVDDNNLIFYAFDLLYYDKYNLMPLSLVDRKKILQKLLLTENNPALVYSDHVDGSGHDIFKKACSLGLEGIISKDQTSPYLQTRNQSWLKVKCIKRQEFVIGGFLPSERRNYFRSLMLGTFNKKQELIYHGNVGTGFTQASLKSLYQLMMKNISPDMSFSSKPPESKKAKWLNPIIIAEVEFTEWTQDGTLRHPSFKGVRMDKNAKNIIKEKPEKVETIEKKRKIPSPRLKKNSLTKPTKKNSLQLTHPDKILYSEDNITKKQLAEYYEIVQEWMIPYIKTRPLTLVRCPVSYQRCFFQKHLDQFSLPGIYPILIREKEGKDDYLYIKESEGLLSLIQLGVLEIHPWNCSIKQIEKPDMIIFDLDPATNVPWKNVVKAAFEIKQLMHDYQLESFLKTTGGKGLHVIIPIKPNYDWDLIKTFAKTVVDYLMMKNNKNYIDVMTKSKRKGKIFIDYLRNSRGATSIAPYSTRARIHAPIATPIAWDELTNDIRDTSFDIFTLPKRLMNLKKDPWLNFLKIKQSLHLSKSK